MKKEQFQSQDIISVIGFLIIVALLFIVALFIMGNL
jgi:hypothetical protein